MVQCWCRGSGLHLVSRGRCGVGAMRMGCGWWISAFGGVQTQDGERVVGDIY